MVNDNFLDTVGPSNLVEGKPNVDCSKVFVPFGTYTLVYIGTNNTFDARKVAAIYLSSTNDFGEYYFLSLETGKTSTANNGMSRQLVKV